MNINKLWNPYVGVKGLVAQRDEVIVDGVKIAGHLVVFDVGAHVEGSVGGIAHARNVRQIAPR